MTSTCDIAVVGSGFAGSLMAMIAHRLGRSVILIDKAKHPRVVIGESSTPLTNLLLEELIDRYDLPALKPLVKWGSWQRAYPEVACGLKRGFTFYHHDREWPSSAPPDRARQLLVAASPNSQIADTHWYRADFDHFLVRQAKIQGVTYLDETNITSVTRSVHGIHINGIRSGQDIEIHANFVIDATGARGLLHRHFRLKELTLPDLPKAEALYSHFSGVKNIADLDYGRTSEIPPYPIDDAAVHHIFDGGWVWVLQFNNGITSAGVAANDIIARELNFADPPKAWEALLRCIAPLQEQFSAAKAVLPFTHLPSLSFRSETVCGSNWALLPSAAGFVDPLLSTGFPLTLFGVARLASLIDKDWSTCSFINGLHRYAADTEAELLAAARLVASLYANMNDFPVFAALSLLYFASVSFSETARRLGRPALAPSFLLHDHPVFGPESKRLLARSLQPRTASDSRLLIDDIHKAIEPYNIAGLGDPLRKNWYPVDVEDLFSSAWKLGGSREDVEELLDRCGFIAAGISGTVRT